MGVKNLSVQAEGIVSKIEERLSRARRLSKSSMSPAARKALSFAPSSEKAKLRPLVLGLTGSIGMGKSTATAYFRGMGIRVHDADACVHRLYAPGGKAVGPICEHFPGVRTPEGGIDRKALSAFVAASGREDALKTLEAVVHPLVAADRDDFIARATSDRARDLDSEKNKVAIAGLESYLTKMSSTDLGAPPVIPSAPAAALATMSLAPAPQPRKSLSLSERGASAQPLFVFPVLLC